ncbi:hypothetical protein MBANPS3_012308 [Mucor bainieri]
MPPKSKRNKSLKSTMADVNDDEDSVYEINDQRATRKFLKKAKKNLKETPKADHPQDNNDVVTFDDTMDGGEYSNCDITCPVDSSDKTPLYDFWKVKPELEAPLHCECTEDDIEHTLITVFMLFTQEAVFIKHCAHRSLFDTLILMQVLPTSTISPRNGVHVSVFELLRSFKLDAYVSIHDAFRKALDNHNMNFHEYKPSIKSLPSIFNSMVVIYNNIKKHAMDVVFAACLLTRMDCYACHNAPRLAIAMDGNFSLKRLKRNYEEATNTDIEGVFATCHRENQIYGSTAEVAEFAQEDYVSKDEV